MPRPARTPKKKKNREINRQDRSKRDERRTKKLKTTPTLPTPSKPTTTSSRSSGNDERSRSQSDRPGRQERLTFTMDSPATASTTRPLSPPPRIPRRTLYNVPMDYPDLYMRVYDQVLEEYSDALPVGHPLDEQTVERLFREDIQSALDDLFDTFHYASRLLHMRALGIHGTVTQVQRQRVLPLIFVFTRTLLLTSLPFQTPTHRNYNVRASSTSQHDLPRTTRRRTTTLTTLTTKETTTTTTQQTELTNGDSYVDLVSD